MNRMLSAIVVVIATSDFVAAEETRTLTAIPQGTWQQKHDDGTIVSLTITDKLTTWVGVFSDGTMTIKLPGWQLSSEGVVFGYGREHTWATPSATQSVTTLIPFAFNAKFENDQIVVRDLRILGLNEKAITHMVGKYHKFEPATAGKTQAPTSTEIKR
jgi:hypothetical protein